MTAEQEHNFADEPLEQVIGSYDVDGISFVQYKDHVEGGGWQGRYFYFASKDFSAVMGLLSQISNSPVRGPLNSQISLKTRDNQDVTFNAHQQDGWVRITDKTGKREIEIANADVPGIRHILGEFESFVKSGDNLGEHFCKEFGIEDDD